MAEGSKGMDPALWSQLQNHTDLATMVYVKLPIGDFSRLPLVCKEWNRLASNRGFLESIFSAPISHPYFVVGTNWSYNDSSQRWTWTRIRHRLPRATTGMYLDDTSTKRVFSVHTRVLYIDPTPGRESSPFGCYDHYNGNCLDSLTSMAEDTSVQPCTFQIILNRDGDWETRMYHSATGSWTNNPCAPAGGTVDDENFDPVSETAHPSLAQCNSWLRLH